MRKRDATLAGKREDMIERVRWRRLVKWSALRTHGVGKMGLLLRAAYAGDIERMGRLRDKPL